MAESTLALYRATGSAKYLRAGESLLGALQANSRVACGYASVGDVGTGETEDRMDSFFIAETLKYLFLLFDRCVPTHHRVRRSNLVSKLLRRSDANPRGSAVRDTAHEKHKGTVAYAYVVIQRPFYS